MINILKPSVATETEATISEVIERYGAVRVLLGALRALVTRKETHRFPDAPMCDHLRRDIGLPPEIEQLAYWDRLG